MFGTWQTSNKGKQFITITQFNKYFVLYCNYSEFLFTNLTETLFLKIKTSKIIPKFHAYLTE